MANDVSTSERSRRLPAGRRAALLEHLSSKGQLTVGEIAEQFSVSIDTIRRDLDQLDAEGLLIRTHGGAVSVASVPRSDRGLDVRLRMQTAEKEAIAQLAAGLVVDGSVLMLNGGTTTLAVARALRDHRQLTVATNNLRIPAEVPVKALRDLYVFGGSVRTVGQTTTGPVSFQLTPGGEQLAVQADLAIIAVGAVSTTGYSTSNLGDAAMMAEMMAHASKVAILADSSKFGRRLFAQIAELGRADWFVTDAPPPADLAAALASAEVEVLTP
ncbi:DeoR/GlpR family DNA-binding transcription regulator [Microbacterium timonense]|uniref:DeoR/GlpR family DNA-binding transcription regulator n=1 Tax=Microbacterium timonense TaxID=2086576 RepID=UPI000D100C54|nr:DeoR/GlpR family DNA-binding transcription regulator [Microbacterium timonense]